MFPCLGNWETVRVYTKGGAEGREEIRSFLLYEIEDLRELWVGLSSGELEVGSR